MNLKGLLPQDAEFIEDWLATQAQHRGLDLGESFLLRHSVGRIAANNIRLEYPKRSDEFWGDPMPRREQLNHILDWLVSSLREGAPWLGNLDERGRPRKLLKCRSFDDLAREADKEMARKNAQVAKALGPDDEQRVADLSEGHSLVRLLTPAALDLESRRMHHCVGHGSYDLGVLQGNTEILSLRDRKGRPVLTVELDVCQYVDAVSREIHQVQGKANGSPDPACMAILKPFARSAGWKGRAQYWPFVVGIDGTEHDVDAIPPGTAFASLQLALPYGMQIALPPDIVVVGHVWIGHGVAAIPERFTVGGDLYVSGSPESPVRLTESLEVGGRIAVGAAEDIVGPIPEHLKDKIKIVLVPQRKLTGTAWRPIEPGEGLDGVDGEDGEDYRVVQCPDPDDEEQAGLRP